MTEPNPPRFRIRLDDGAELPVGSVEALSRRVARGDVGPTTQLFDGSTGKWNEAATAPVVQFILDELRREGRDLPPEWAPGEEAGPAGEPASPLPVEAPPVERDPLDLKLTPAANSEDLGPALKNAFSSPDPSGRMVPSSGWGSGDVSRPGEPEVVRPGGPRARDGEWVTPHTEGGLFTPVTVPQPGPGLESREEVTPALPRRRPARRPAGGGAWMGLAALALVALVASGVLLGDGGSDAEESAPRSASELASESTPLPPQGLEAATARAIALIDRRFTAAVDSSRVAHGLASAPPESWLTGYYLANATQFPDVRAYWQSYGALLEGLRVLDRALVADVIENELDPSIVLAADRSRVAAHLEERYASALPRRQELYTQLSAAAASAIALHDFLVSAGDEIRYTPALGGEVIPRDPVLEVGAEDPAVRARLEANLDAIFEALDRSRGGGAPAQANLEEDLFGRFATF